MAKHIEKNINGNTYKVFPMLPMDALDYAPKVAAIVADALGAVDMDALFGLIHREGGEDMDLAKIAEMIIGALSSLKPADISEIMKEAFTGEVLCADGRLNNEETFNKWFQQHKGDMLQVGIWLIWEHSKDYFLQDGTAFQAEAAEKLSQFLKEEKKTTSSDAS